MTMHINYQKYECPLCGRRISRPNYSRHLAACKHKEAKA